MLLKMVPIAEAHGCANVAEGRDAESDRTRSFCLEQNETRVARPKGEAQGQVHGCTSVARGHGWPKRLCRVNRTAQRRAG